MPTFYPEFLQKVPKLELLQTLATKQQVTLYAVGGCVRDFFLDKPSKDLDLVCVGDVLQLATDFAKKINQPIQLFKRFGTAMVRYQNWEIEFVAARKESYRSDSRSPFVTPATLQEDLSRRDFTLNALAIPLNGPTAGKLIDLFDGLTDLKAGILRTPLDPLKTFSDDPLRMWRAIRFATCLPAKINPATFQALTQKAKRSHILTQERITTELNYMLAAERPSTAFILLDRSGLLQQILPEITALKGREKRGRFSHKDNFWHTLEVLDNVAVRSTNLYLRWAALLHDVAKPKTKRFHPQVGFTFHAHEELGARMVPKLFRRLKLPLGAPMRYVQKLVRLHLRPIALVQEVTDAAIRRLIYDAGDTLHDLMKLCRADITSKNPKRIEKYFSNFDLVEAKMETIEKKDHIRNLQPVLNGEMIMYLFDLAPGKLVGVLKKSLKEAILSGNVSNAYAPLFEYLRPIAAKEGLQPVHPLEAGIALFTSASEPPKAPAKQD